MLFGQRRRARAQTEILLDRVRTPEHAAKIGAAQRGKPKHTEDHKQRLREEMAGANNPNFGKKASPGLRARLSAAHIGIQAGEKNPNYGKKMTEEHKARLLEARRTKAAARRLLHPVK